MAKTDNIYSWTRHQAFERFKDRIEGTPDAITLVVYTSPLSERARDALAKSFSALGHDSRSYAYARIDGFDAREVFELVEGLDPLYLIATDEVAATLCAQAARQPFPFAQPTRFFGRDARAFLNVNAQLETEAGRQRIWYLLKSLLKEP